MTALQVIHLQVTFPRHQRAKSDQFQKSWKQFYRNSHKTQVSLCFFTLSLLTSCISATPVNGTADLQICLKGLKDAIEGFSAREQNSWFHQLQAVIQLLKQQSSPRPPHYHHLVWLNLMPCCTPQVQPAKQCTHKVLRCYMLELKVIIREENVDINKTECILIFDERLKPETNCSECEVYPLENSTTFYNKFKTILESLTSEKNTM
ncbi:uncharacterized protein LOC118563226 isoform X1 [Fundulus heteroclitus]|uniref:uncharacterized protein LOC118563226 isoform X1 n=1 Tax=Fundulus heteroclitus TaxID=8078 RepID=UPI00165B5357|nr:uncharacterized protein LOC118563226 isoform X1 [Fundulus heteroclitus]